ncbi:MULTISPECIES: LacI family DNA-binding transcriptional regulator [Luteococcus]|uniref:LacI family DNA-binding transcriptional regulator n=1 Tax=Luteococcus TaxID=33983 RepID=UPI0015C3095E|nr:MULTISPECIES: LacI family DNA-binding transcriptional regulator [Luteococcus]MDN5564278.1 LacI family transcriptional regulator [Luteococcus sp.]
MRLIAAACGCVDGEWERSVGKVTMRDIAQVMGVSVMTVSNAFNRPDQLSAELRGRILARAAKMGYTGPNAVARQLREGRTRVFGVVVTQGVERVFEDPYQVILLGGLAAELEAAGANILLVGTGHDDVDPMMRVGVDGFVGMCTTHPMAAAASRRGLPLVTTDPMDGVDGWVSIDDRQAGLAIADHVRRLGHRRVTVVVEQTVPEHPCMVVQQPDHLLDLLQVLQADGIYDVWPRTLGVLEGLEGLDVDVVCSAGSSCRAGREAAAVVMDRQDRPTAVVALSDALALGVLDALRERGVVPGRDVSVTGFDDLPDAAAGLTTIRQPIRDKGRLLGQLLLGQTGGERHIVLDHELVVRSSTGPAPR